jgi:hypothetical protein
VGHLPVTTVTIVTDRHGDRPLPVTTVTIVTDRHVIGRGNHGTTRQAPFGAAVIDTLSRP